MARVSEEDKARLHRTLARCPCGHWLIGIGPGATLMPPSMERISSGVSIPFRHKNPLCEFYMTTATTENALKLYKPPFKYDFRGTFIVDADLNRVLDVRGWGRIQYTNKDRSEAGKLQDLVGEEIVKALNAHWAPEPEPPLGLSIVTDLTKLTDGQRLDVFNSFCKHCGGTKLPCHCWNDE